LITVPVRLPQVPLIEQFEAMTRPHNNNNTHFTNNKSQFSNWRAQSG